MPRTLYAIYDFGASPASYDFATFLTMAAMARDAGKYEHLHVVFVPANTDTGFRIDVKPISPAQKAWRRDNLLVPMCALVKATATVLPTRDDVGRYIVSGATWPQNYRPDEPGISYLYSTLKRMARYIPLPDFCATEEARRMVRDDVPNKYVTITLRTTYGEDRNSDPQAWHDFANHAAYLGYRPIIIPDTARVSEGSGIGALAALNVQLRFALYQGAAMNLAVNGGPPWMALYAGLPLLMFRMVADYYSVTPEFFARIELPVGTQPPFATPKQKLVWENDTFPVIRSNFEEIMADA